MIQTVLLSMSFLCFVLATAFSTNPNRDRVVTLGLALFVLATLIR